MKKIVLVLLLILITIIVPLIGLSLFVIYLIYILVKQTRQKDVKKTLKNKINSLELFIKNIFSKDFDKIYLKDKIEVYKIDRYIMALKQGMKWSLIVAFKVNKFKIDGLNIPLKEVYLIKNANDSMVIIKDDFLSFKLSNSLLKSKISGLISKLEMVSSYLVSRGIEVELVEVDALKW